MSKLINNLICEHLKISLLIIFTFVFFLSYGQETLGLKLDGSEKGKNLQGFLEELEKKHPIKFYFLPDWFSNISLDKDYQNQTLQFVFTDLFLGTDLNYLEFSKNTIVFVKDPSRAIQHQTLLSEAIQEQRKIEQIQLGELSKTKQNLKIVIRGTVSGKNNEPLVGASVFVKDLSLGISTDPQGKFQIQLPTGQHIMNFSFVNYEEKVINLNAFQDGDLAINLEELPTVLEEVVVQDKATKEDMTSSIGQVQISMKELKRAPSFMGEVDLIKQIQTLPGVSTAGEAASGFNVRGGSVDQNLILYDGMPVFNSSHVFGFFSAFNSEAIRDVTFYKGGIPAEFGGRVSSILEIHSKEGDAEKWKGGAGIGIISSNVNIGGPIVKEKTTLSTNFRTTYSDWLINTIRTDYIDLSNSTVTFYDGSLKLTHKFTKNTKLTFSGYASRDQFRLAGDSTYRWKNLLGSLKLDHIFSSRLTSSLHIGYGTYGYEVIDSSPNNGFNLSYKITYPSLKADFRYHYGRHKVSLGVQAQDYTFNPGTLKPNSQQSTIKSIEMEQQQSIESAVYIGDSFAISEKLNLDAGLRFSMFSSFGSATVNTYKEGLPMGISNLTGAISYKSGETIKSYSGLEPRIGFRYTFSPTSSIKLGYNRMYQYLHLVTNSTAVTPIDIWQPSGYYFKPQLADQFSVGYFRTSKNKMYDASVEVFHKEINNILDFKDGANLILNKYIEADLLQGKGLAYGVETQITKSLGRLTGSVTYTYSRSLRTIKGATDAESINKGKEYPSNFDQPHVVNLSWKYNISKRYFFTGNFTYRTGRPVTLPVSSFVVEGITISNFSERNQYRIQDYHRLDIALVLEGSHRRKKIFDGTWTFSIFNLYGRKNPYTVYFQSDANGVLIPYQLSIIGTALPSIMYTVKF